jgi:oligopeptidase B
VEATTLRIDYSSPTTQQAAMALDMKSYKLNVIFEKKLEGRPVNPASFVSEMVEVPGHDGETIPVSLFHQRGIVKDRSNRLLLKGYGAYGTTADHSFRFSELTSVEDGWVVAQAHVRGDAEKGRQWHKDGSLQHKPNSFKDFESVANWLVSEGYTRPAKMAALGTSAGGLLVGALANARPGLFSALVLEVPFVDVLSLMLNSELPLTAAETEEWGDPITCPAAYDLIRSYSPYENILQQEYPPMYITVGLKDMRVPYWSTLKYIKRLRERALGD